MVGDETGVKRYENAREGFALELPASWTARMYPGPAALIARAADDGGFAPNMNVSLAAPTDDLESFVERELERAADYLTDLQIRDRERVTVAGRPAIRVLSRYRQGRFSIALAQWIIDHDSRQVTISAAAEESEWHSAEPRFKTMVESFEFL